MSQNIELSRFQRAKVRPKRAGKKTKIKLNCKSDLRARLLERDASLAIAPTVPAFVVTSGNEADVDGFFTSIVTVTMSFMSLTGSAVDAEFPVDRIDEFKGLQALSTPDNDLVCAMQELSSK